MPGVDAFFEAEIAEHEGVVAAAKAALRQPFVRLVSAATGCIRSGGKILFFGNGGSAADAQHLATELVVRYHKNRPAIAAIALTTDSSAITAIGNDFGFEDIFSRQIEALGRAGDLAIGISTSGRSQNVLRGLRKAREIGMIAAGFGGGTGGELRDVADPLLIVPSQATARIQEFHIILGHMLCSALETELRLVN